MMLRALQLAEKGLYSTSPNPRVGCVIVSHEGHIVGEGYHRRAGEAHAEVLALAEAGDKAKGACAYVSLEPCSHTGRTGPCSDALINAGINEVVYAMEDPNPEVSGQGIERLRDAGITVRGPVQESAALELNKGFCKRMQRNLPWVRCKLAMSLDGRTAMADGSSKWVTGPAARADVQYLRARSCAVITGVGTVTHDNPNLNVRLPDTERQPMRIVVDSQLRTPLHAELFKLPGRIVVACAADASEGKEFPLNNVETWSLGNKDNSAVDLRRLLQLLAEREQCNEVMIEAGAGLAGAFLATGLVDELIIYMAAKLMGKDARPLFDISINSMAGCLPMSIQDIRAVGHDWRITALPDPEG